MKNVLDQIANVPGQYGIWSACTTGEILKLTGPLNVTEIGAGYGTGLKHFAHLAKRSISIDAMYDWVPDVQESDGHAQDKVSKDKIDRWSSEAKKCGSHVSLIIGNSYLVHDRNELADTELLIIDGCHHPVSSVLKDFTLYRKHLTEEFYVVWDDVNESDVAAAIKEQRKILETDGYQISERQFGSAIAQFVKK